MPPHPPSIGRSGKRDLRLLCCAAPSLPWVCPPGQILFLHACKGICFDSQRCLPLTELLRMFTQPIIKYIEIRHLSRPRLSRAQIKICQQLNLFFTIMIVGLRSKALNSARDVDEKQMAFRRQKSG